MVDNVSHQFLVAKTRFYYVDSVYITAILRRKSGIKPPAAIHNGPLMCQHLGELRFLQKRYQLEYSATEIDQLHFEAHQKKLELV